MCLFLLLCLLAPSCIIMKEKQTWGKNGKNILHSLERVHLAPKEAGSVFFLTAECDYMAALHFKILRFFLPPFLLHFVFHFSLASLRLLLFACISRVKTGFVFMSF